MKFRETIVHGRKRPNCFRNDVIIGYMEKASKFRDTVIIRVDCKHIATLQATG